MATKFKKLDEMSKAEMLQLTDEGIEMLIDYECALNSVPLLPERPVEPRLKKPEPDVELHRVGSFYFGDHEDASEVLKVVNSLKRFRTNYESTGIYTVSEGDNYGDEAKITLEKVYSKARYEEVKAEIEKHNREKNEYTAAMKEYEQAAKKRREVAERVVNAIHEAGREAAQRENFKTLYDRYVLLASGNLRIAMDFLRNAYGEIDEIPGLVVELYESHGYFEPTEAQTDN